MTSSKRYEELAKHLDDPERVIVDARFVLTAPERAEQNYQRSHVPGAVYAHLDRELSSAIVPGSGRHPLPRPADLAATEIPGAARSEAATYAPEWAPSHRSSKPKNSRTDAGS